MGRHAGVIIVRRLCLLRIIFWLQLCGAHRLSAHVRTATFRASATSVRALKALEDASSPPELRRTVEGHAESPHASVASAWDRGESAAELRRVVEGLAESQGERAAAASAASTTVGWRGLWEARIEHFEKVAFTGLRVRPYYELDDDGGIVSHVHVVAPGPFPPCWVSASGIMKPASEEAATVKLVFGDFWISGDRPKPRDSPADLEASAVDKLVRRIGRAAFFEGLADFPVDYADLKSDGIVAFRFTAFNSQIVARRLPPGALPQRCADAD